MKKSYVQAVRLATALVAKASRQTTTTCSVQSALTPVRSVECGHFA